MEGSGEGEGEGRVRSGDGAARRQIPAAAPEVVGHGASVAGQGTAVTGVAGHGAGVAGAAGVAAQDQSVVGSQGRALAGVSSLGAARAPASLAFVGGVFFVPAPGAWPGGASGDWCSSSGSCDNSCSDEEEDEVDIDDIWFQEQIGKLVDMSKRTMASLESLAARREESGPSIEHVMQLVQECGATYGTNEHFIATTIFTKRAEKEMFLTMHTPEERFQWLKMKYEWMTRNRVAK